MDKDSLIKFGWEFIDDGDTEAGFPDEYYKKDGFKLRVYKNNGILIEKLDYEDIFDYQHKKNFSGICHSVSKLEDILNILKVK